MLLMQCYVCDVFLCNVMNGTLIKCGRKIEIQKINHKHKKYFFLESRKKLIIKNEQILGINKHLCIVMIVIFFI